MIECRFGWVNASYIFGLTFLTSHMIRALGTCTPFEVFDKATATAIALNGEF